MLDLLTLRVRPDMHPNREIGGTMKQPVVVRFALAVIFAITGIARAEPVVYTLYAVPDGGQLGSKAFSQAEVVIKFKGDTRNVTIETEPGGAVVYRNNQGEATITLIQQGRKSVAHIAKGQIYVRYDTKNGVVGFGSAVSSTYPMALYDDIVGALAAIAANPGVSTSYSDLSGLRANLNETTLLTGRVDSCDPVSPTPVTCPSGPIHTDLGDFSVQAQNQEHGNRGIFTVVVGKDERDDSEDN